MPDAKWIKTQGIIAILRGDYSEHVLGLVDALYSGGIRIVEVTLNSPNAITMIETLNRHYKELMWIGAGTVLTEENVESAAAAGAKFIVSPDTHLPVIRRSQELGLEAIPGAYTASEITAAVRAGATHIKLFPALPAGPGYLKQLLGPLSEVAFIPTGGITEDNIAAFVHAGATAFGVGSALVPKVFTGTQSEVEQVKAKASRICQRMHKARGMA